MEPSGALSGLIKDPFQLAIFVPWEPPKKRTSKNKTISPTSWGEFSGRPGEREGEGREGQWALKQLGGSLVFLVFPLALPWTHWHSPPS